MINPFYSIIIPTYNRAQFLKIAVNSILNQSFDNYELIIVDDGSTDNTKEIVQNYIDIYRHQTSDKRQETADIKKKFVNQNAVLNTKIKYIYQHHKGVSKARNTGITSSKGEFICFLDSDDRFLTEKLQITYDYIKKHPKHSIFHTEEIWYRKGKILTQKGYHKKPNGFVLSESVKLCCIGMSTSVFKKNVFNEIGLFDETMPACEDYDFWIRASLKFPFFLIPEILTIKEGGHPDQESKRYPAMDQLRIYSLKKILEQKILSTKNYNTIYKELIHKCNIYIKGAIKRNKIKEANYYRRIVKKLDKR